METPMPNRLIEYKSAILGIEYLLYYWLYRTSTK